MEVEKVIKEAEELKVKMADLTEKCKILRDRCVSRTETIEEQEKDMAEIPRETDKIRRANDNLDKELEESRKEELVLVEELSSADSELDQQVVDLNMNVQACGVNGSGKAVLSVTKSEQGSAPRNISLKAVKAKSQRVKNWMLSLKEKLKINKSSLEGKEKKGTLESASLSCRQVFIKFLWLFSSSLRFGPM